MPSDWIDYGKLSALTARLRNVGSETADQAADAIGALSRHIEEQDQMLRAAHQERDADARRLAALHRLVAWWDDTTSWGSTRWIAELAAIVENCRAAIDAATAPDTQTEDDDAE